MAPIERRSPSYVARGVNDSRIRLTGRAPEHAGFPAQLGNQLPRSSSFVQALEQLHLPGVVHGMTRDAQHHVEALVIR